MSYSKLKPFSLLLQKCFLPTYERFRRHVVKHTKDIAKGIKNAQVRAEATKYPLVKAWYHAKVDKLQRKWTILVLQGERERIKAWKVLSVSLCTNESFTILVNVLTSLEAEANKDWQTMAYVANFLSNTVSVIATDNNIVIDTIQVGEAPCGVVISPNGTKVYVANKGSHNVTVIDTDDNKASATIQVGKAPCGVAVTPNGAKVYVTNGGSATVSVISTDNNVVIATIHVGKVPCGVAVTPNGTKVYVTNNGSYPGTVSVINTETHLVIATILVEGGPFGVAITPDGIRAYVTNSDTGEDNDAVTVIATDSNAVIAIVPVESGPFGVAVTPDGMKVYVANSISNTVTVLATDDHTKIATIDDDVGDGPCAIAFTPNGLRAYVANRDSHDVSVIVTDSHEAATPAIFLEEVYDGAMAELENSPRGVAIGRLTW
jgi:YVTN family beta-propeller protein